MHRIKKDEQQQAKLSTDSNIIQQMKQRMADNEKELHDLRKYVKILEELFSRTRDQQHYIEIDSQTIIKHCNTSLN